MLEPYAVKVASTVLRRGCHCEVMFLSDNIVLDVKDFGLSLMKKSTIKLDQLRFIDKTRIVKVERKLISKTLKNLIEKKIQNIFKF